MSFAWNIVHVRRLSIVHWALLTETIPYNHVRLLCEYDDLNNSRYLSLGSESRGRIVRVGDHINVDCMACIARGADP